MDGIHHDKDIRGYEVMTSRDEFQDPLYFQMMLDHRLAVGLVEVLPRGDDPEKSGTCFFVTPTVVLTCFHVVGSEDTAKQATFTFQFERPKPGISSTPVTYRAKPDGLYIGNEALDFAFIELLIVPPKDYVPFQLEPVHGMTPAGKIFVTQHPGGAFQKITSGRIISLNARRCTHTAPTNVGSSGAPICNGHAQVIGVHVGAFNRQIYDQQNAEAHLTEPGPNMGLRTKAILETLAARQAEPRIALLLGGLARSGQQATSSQSQQESQSRSHAPRMPFLQAMYLLNRLPLALRIIFIVALLTVGVLVPLVLHSSPSASSSPFDYHYLAPNHVGGTITVGETGTQVPDYFPPNSPLGRALWSTCLTQLPNLGLGSGAFRPDQCSRFPDYAISLHAMTLTLHLDPTYRWSDGQPVTAGDYALGYEFNRDPAINGDFPYYLIQDIHVVDPATLSIRLNQVYADYLFLAAYTFPIPLHRFPGVYDPQSGKYDSTAALKMQASDEFDVPHTVNGPYQIQTLTSTPQEQSVKLVPNRAFHSHFYHRAAADTLLFRYDGSPDQVIANFRAGRYDVVPGLSYFNNHELVQSLPTNEVRRWVTNSVEYLFFNQRPLAPNASYNGNTSIFAGDTGQLVRQAFALATQRCALIQAIADVNCHDPTVDARQYVTMPLPEYDPTTPDQPYDPVQAGKLLDQAGFPVVNGHRVNKDGTPLEIQFYTTTASYRTIVTTLLRQQWEQALKITLQIHQIDGSLLFDTYHNGQLRSGNFDITMVRDTPPADSAIIASTFTSSEIPSDQNPFGYNYGGVNDPALETAFNLAITDFNEADRTQQYRLYHQALVAHTQIIPLFREPNLSLTKSTLMNYVPYPAEAPNTWNIADWWVAPAPAPTSTVAETATPNPLPTSSIPLLRYQGHAGEILGASWSPDGHWIATAGLDHTVQVWNAQTGKPRLIYREHTDAVHTLAWSPDSRYLASSCAYYFDDGLICSDSSIRVWDATTGKTVTVFHGHTKDVPQISWFPDGKRIISAARYDGKAFIWDAFSGNVIASHAISQDTTVLVLDHDGRRVLTLNPQTNTPEIWDSQTGTTLVSLATSGRLQSATWSPDDRRILLGFTDNHTVTYEWWDTTGKKLGPLGNISVRFPGTLAWSPDGRYLAIADGHLIWLVAVASQKPVFVYQGHDGSVYRISGLAWSPDNHAVVSAGSDGVAQVWQVSLAT